MLSSDNELLEAAQTGCLRHMGGYERLDDAAWWNEREKWFV
jgi:hypothetical protein